MIQGRLAYLGGVLALAALGAAGSARAQADLGPPPNESAPMAAASVDGLSQVSGDAWFIGAANLHGPGARAFSGPFGGGAQGPGGPPPSVLRDMPLSRADRGLQAPPVARYAAGQDEVFVFDRSSGAALLKFDDSPEIWVLQPSPAPRGDIIYRNDLGEPILRATRLGGLTLFSANTPGGEAAALVGEADDLQPPPFLSPSAVFQRMLQSSARASRAAQHLIRFDAPEVTPESAPVFVDAAAAASEAVIVLSRRDDGRIFLRRLTKMQFQSAPKPGAVVTPTGDGAHVNLQVFVDLSQGEAGRPSSERLVRAALGY
jgi:hypothetical protein